MKPRICLARLGASLFVGLVLLFAAGAGGCTAREDGARIEEILATLDLSARAGQVVLLSLAERELEGRAGAASGGTSGVELAGVWLRAAGGDAVAGPIPIGSASGLPLLVGTDLDGGPGLAPRGGTSFPPLPRMLGSLEAEDLGRIGAHMAAEASRAGVNLGLVRAPPLLGGAERAASPYEAMATGLEAFLSGARGGGLSIAVRVLWAPGPEVIARTWDLARFEALDVPLLRAAVGEGAAALVPGNLSLPGITGDDLPLPFSPTGLSGLLRRDLGWSGVILADLRGETGGDQSPAEAAVRAIAAGSDLILVEGDPSVIVEELLRAVEEGRLPAGRLDAAARRVLALRLRLPQQRAPDEEDSLALASDGAELAGTAAGRAVIRLSLLPFAPPAGSRTLLLTPVGRGRSFAAALTATHPVRDLPLNLTADSAALVDLVRREVSSAHTVVYLDFAGDGRPTLQQLIRSIPIEEIQNVQVVRIAFRDFLDDEIESSPPDVFAWGSGAPVQIEAARVLVAEPAPAAAAPLLAPPAPILREVEPSLVGMSSTGLQAADRAIQDALDRGIFASAALAVGRRGGLVRLRGYGSLPTGEPIDPRATLFDIASLTKVVATATAAAALVESGELELDAPIDRYVPDFRGGEKGEVTVRHLLTHTSGMAPGLPLFGSANSREQALEQVILQPLRRDPGEQVEYSDLGMILLAEVIERAAGMPIDLLLARRVLDPLGMGSTTFTPPLAIHGGTVPSALRSERPFPLRGVVHDGNAFRLGGVAGHAGLFSTAADLAVFCQAMLNGGRYGTVEILADSTVRTFTTRQPRAGERALGWDTPADRSSAGRFLSARSFGHTGYTGTSIWIDPDRELFVVLLTNRTYTRATASAILSVRIAVHEAVARAITNEPVAMRPGAR